MEREKLDTLINIVERSQGMCPVCKELFNQITWELIREFERVISSGGKRRSLHRKKLSDTE
ncbi:hypothetical protein KEJ39_00015 [Candidatus Bathyarchaeota archaeon]|nr:hypothetical protein [Candidatus Bathyarchaeota archaeon]